MKKNQSLSDAWVDSCLRLWSMCERAGRNTDNITLWDAFKLLYLDNVPDNLVRGRKATGVNNVITD